MTKARSVRVKLDSDLLFQARSGQDFISLMLEPCSKPVLAPLLVVLGRLDDRFEYLQYLVC